MTAGPIALAAYLDRWTAAPGERVSVMVSTPSPSFEADVVRLTGGGPRRPTEPDALRCEAADVTLESPFAGGEQPLFPGSYVRIPHDPGLSGIDALAVHAWVQPTRPRAGRDQGIVSKWDAAAGAGWALVVDAGGRLALRWFSADGNVLRVAAGAELHAGEWYEVTCEIDARAGAVRIRQVPVRATTGAPHEREAELPDAALDSTAPVLIGGAGLVDSGGVDGAFNGKIDRPSLRAAGELLADWDLSLAIPTRRVVDASGRGRDGLTVNSPVRGVTGHDWTGESLDFTARPSEYGAIHFHDDDLDDAGWAPSFGFELPPHARSGVYAVRLSTEEATDLVPLFVRPRHGSATASIAFVAPTLTYLAYSNYNALWFDPTSYTGGAAVYDPIDPVIAAHPELGWSIYDRHSDGSGIVHASRLRPTLNVRPGHRYWMSNGGGWSLSGDMYLVDWLEARGHRYDVLTDEDVHREGVELLSRYRVILTGAHPEYTTGPMLDAYEAYAERGGRIMYLGGNGFYWVTTVLPDRPGVMEVRRGHSGTRTWESSPGELHHSSTGEPGGLWRHRGRAPQRTFGVGFAAQGGGGSAGYVRTPDSDDPRAAFIFEGVGRDEVIGEFGNNMGGAAGDELDRLDHGLGTPPHALLLATSSGRHSDLYQRTVEEVPVIEPSLGGTTCREVRADMVFFETPAGGAVFSVGSIDWSASLSHNGYDNNVSTITGNVLRAFEAA